MQAFGRRIVALMSRALNETARLMIRPSISGRAIFIAMSRADRPLRAVASHVSALGAARQDDLDDRAVEGRRTASDWSAP